MHTIYGRVLEESVHKWSDNYCTNFLCFSSCFQNKTLRDNWRSNLQTGCCPVIQRVATKGTQITDLTGGRISATGLIISRSTNSQGTLTAVHPVSTIYYQNNVTLLLSCIPSVLCCCWLGGKKGIWPVKNWVVGCWRGYLPGARCRLAYTQLMPLLLTVSCFSKIQLGFTFLVLAHLVVPDKGPLNGCVCFVSRKQIRTFSN